MNKILALAILAAAISTPALAAGHASPNSIIAPQPRAATQPRVNSIIAPQPRQNSIIAPLPR